MGVILLRGKEPIRLGMELDRCASAGGEQASLRRISDKISKKQARLNPIYGTAVSEAPLLDDLQTLRQQPIWNPEIEVGILFTEVCYRHGLDLV